jgi:hypothetical protein
LQNALEMKKMFSKGFEDADDDGDGRKKSNKTKKRKARAASLDGAARKRSPSRKVVRNEDVDVTEDEDEEDVEDVAEQAAAVDNDATIEDDDFPEAETVPKPKKRKTTSSSPNQPAPRVQLEMLGDRRGRGRRWSDEETNLLLEHLNEVTPGETPSWSLILAELRAVAPDNFADRDSVSLKDKARNIKRAMIRENRTRELGAWAKKVAD